MAQAQQKTQTNLAPPYNIFSLDYWFGQVDTRPLSLFRIFYALLLLKDAVYHFPLLYWFYTDNGIFPLDTLFEVARNNRFSLLDALPRDWMVFGFFLIWIAVLLCLLVGWNTRLMTILNFVMLLSIHERNLYLLNGGDTVVRVQAFFMMFLPMAQYYSVGAIRKRMKHYTFSSSPGDLRPDTQPRTTFAFPFRMLQYQFALVYVFAMATKLPGGYWLRGESLALALQLVTFQQLPGRLFLELAPSWLLVGLTIGTLIVEGSWFPLVFAPVFQPTLRRIALVSGALLHLGIGVMMSIPNFSMIMIMSYVLFLTSAEIKRAEDKLRQSTGTASMPQPQRDSPLWLLVAALKPGNLTLDLTTKQTTTGGDLWHITGRSGRRVSGAAAWREVIGYFPFSKLWGWLLQIKPVRSALWLATTYLMQRTPLPQPDATAEPFNPPPPSETLKFVLYGVVSVFLVMLMAFITWWNLSTVDTDRVQIDIVRGVPRAVIQYTGMWQGWSTFAPYPNRTYGWIVIDGVFEDGTTFDLLTGEPLGEVRQSWKFGPNIRWRKFETRVRESNNDLLDSWAGYYCHYYNRDLALPEGQRLASLEFRYQFYRTTLPGEEPKGMQEDLVWKHWCYEEYRY